MDTLGLIKKATTDCMRRVSNQLSAAIWAGTTDPWALAWRIYGAHLSRHGKRL